MRINNKHIIRLLHFIIVLYAFSIGKDLKAQSVQYGQSLYLTSEIDNGQINTNYATGTTAGEASVINGASGYSIPLVLPPGTGGVVPALTLSYSSNGGNGHFGRGWGLSGLSSISRGPQTTYYDGQVQGVKYNNEDRFYLNGERLIALNGAYGAVGTEYGTEGENFSRIISTGGGNGNPDYFVMTMKDGVVYEFGKDFNSKLISPSAVGIKYNLSKIRYPDGNYVEFAYIINQAKSGFNWVEQVIDEVRYTGNTAAGILPSAVVKFNYGIRIDENETYDARQSSEMRLLVTSIDISTDGNISRKYFIEYAYRNENSYIRNITEGGANGMFLNPTRFEYGEAGGISTAAPIINDLDDVFPSNLNGDGVQDLLLARKIAPTASTHEYFYSDALGSQVTLPLSTSVLGTGDSNGDGLDEVATSIEESVIIRDGNFNIIRVDKYLNLNLYHNGTNVNGSLPYNVISNRRIAIGNLPNTHIPEVSIGDYNGDGLTDYLVTRGSQISIAYGQRSASVPIGDWTPISVTPGSFTAASNWYNDVERFYVADFNSDGRSDILLINGGVAAIYSILTGTTQLTEIFFNNGLSTPINTRLFDQQNIIHFGDFNSDGLTDILRRSTDTGPWSVLLGKINIVGQLYFELSPTPSGFSANQTQPSYGTYIGDQVSVADYNGDGKSDIMTLRSGSGNTSFTTRYFSEGKIFGSRIFNTLPTISFVSTYNGITYLGADGQPRLLYRPYSTQGNSSIGLGINSKESLLLKVRNGENHTAIFGYKLMTEKIDLNDDFYTRGSLTDATQKVSNITYPAWLVKDFKVSNGLEANSYGDQSMKVQDYKYEGASVHRTGKGIMGFRKIRADDKWSYLSTVTSQTFNDDFGLTLPNTVDINYLFGQGTFTQSSTIQNITTLPNNRYILKAASSTFDNLFESRKSVTTYNSYDAYANITSSTTSTYTGNSNQLVETKNQAIQYGTFGAPYPDKPISITGTTTRAGQSAYTTTATMGYNNKGQVEQQVEFSGLPQQVTTTYTYHAHGGLNTTTRSASGVPTQTSTNSYDPKGRFITGKTNSLGQTIYSAVYDARWGKPTSTTDEAGQTSSYQYDGLGRNTISTSATGIVSTQSYNWNVGANTTTTATSQTTARPSATANMDFLGRAVSATTLGMNNAPISTTTTYDVLGRTSMSTAPAKSGEAVFTTTHSYQGAFTAQKPYQSINNFGTTTYAYSYTNGVEKTTVTSPDFKTTSSYTDVTGKQVRMTDSNNKDLLYTYYSHGGLKEVTMDGISLLSITYDAYARKIGQIDKSAGTTSYAYDAYGRMTSETNPKGQTTSTTYDVLDRIEVLNRPEGVTSHEYWPAGVQGKAYKIKKITGHQGDVNEYDYDGFGRAKTQTITKNGTAYTTTLTYDSNDRLSTKTYASGLTLTYQYDANSYLTHIKNGSTVYANILQQNGRGQTTQMTTGDGKTRNYTYYHGVLTRINTTDGAFDLNMTWDYTNLNLQSRYDNRGNSEEFTYDNLDRLYTSTRTNAQGTKRDTVLYSPQGNITYKSDIGDYAYDPNKIFAVTSVQNKEGIIASPEQNIVYNSFEQPASITQGIYRLEFDYDHSGSRIVSRLYVSNVLNTTKTYLGDYEKIEQNGQTKFIHYISTDVGLVAIVESTGGTHTPHYTYTDHLGSIVMATSSSGAIEAEQNFDPWGRYRSAANWSYIANPTLPIWLYRGYTGHEHLPEFQLIHMNARLYDPQLGRMLSPDNEISMAGYSQNYNRYSYALNNPLKYTDPDGNNPLVSALIGAGISVVTNGLSNLDQGRGFFAGAGKAALMGAVSGLISAGIGEAASYITNGYAKAAFQFVAHGLSGGVMSSAQGGKFIHGFASGSISSLASSGAGALNVGPEAMILVGGITGGVSSKISGGSFWDGVRQGLITSALNHVAHLGADAIGKYLENRGGGDPGDRLLRMKLAEQMSKKHGGTIKEWYKKLSLNELNRGIENSNSIFNIEVSTSIASALGFKGGFGFVFSGEEGGIYVTGGPNFGFDMSFIGLSMGISSPVISGNKLTLNDFNGTSVAKSLGVGMIDLSTSSNTQTNGNFGIKLNPYYRTSTIGVSYGSPFGLTYSIQNAKILLSW